MSGFGDAHWLYTNHVFSTGLFVNAGSISAGSTDWSNLGRGEGYEFSAGFEPYDPPDKPPPDPEDPFGAPMRPKPELGEIFLGTLEVHHNGPHLFITFPFWLLFGLGALLTVICTSRTSRRWQARSRRELVDYPDSNP
jgi:hypothetical protein